MWAPLGAVALMIGLMGARAQTGATIATVNVPEILEQTPGFTDAQARFEQELEDDQQELQNLQRTMEAKVQQFEQEQAQLDPRTRQSRIDDLRATQQRLQSRAQEMEEQAMEREGLLLGPFQDQVQTAIDELRAERNVDLIVDITMEGSGFVSANPELDITYTVIQRIQGR
jgi:Skp family chaperone for outer membrane proteins